MDKISKIIGVGKYIPQKVVKSSELEEQINFEKLGIRKGTCNRCNSQGHR